MRCTGMDVGVGVVEDGQPAALLKVVMRELRHHGSRLGDQLCKRVS